MDERTNEQWRQWKNSWWWGKMHGENGGAIAIGNPLNIRPDILVGNGRNLCFIGIAVGGAVQFVPLQVLGLRILAQYLCQNLLLYCTCIRSYLLDKLYFFAPRRRHRRSRSTAADYCPGPWKWKMHCRNSSNLRTSKKICQWIDKQINFHLIKQIRRWYVNPRRDCVSPTKAV